MHHSLRLYTRYREWFLRYYIFQAKWTAIPLVGSVVRKVANLYGKNVHSAHSLTLADAEEIIDKAEELAIGPCTCRAVFHHCHAPIETELIVSFSRQVFIKEKPHEFREITKREARDVLMQCHQNGLIHTIVKCRGDYYAICNCCSCCCVPLRLSKKYGIGNALTRWNRPKDFQLTDST